MTFSTCEFDITACTATTTDWTHLAGLGIFAFISIKDEAAESRGFTKAQRNCALFALVLYALSLCVRALSTAVSAYRSLKCS